MRISDWSSDVCSSDLMRRVAPDWLDGCALRECWFEPTFHKHHGNLCNSLMIHAEGPFYDHHAFRPWRLQALAFKAVRNLEIGRTSCRERVCQYVLISVVGGYLKKKKKQNHKYN